MSTNLLEAIDYVTHLKSIMSRLNATAASNLGTRGGHLTDGTTKKAPKLINLLISLPSTTLILICG